MTAPLLDVRHISKEFVSGSRWFGGGRSVRAVNDVSLTIERGEVRALVGESGSGKTTLGRCILRLMEPTGGSIHFDGVDVRGLRGKTLRTFRRRMQIVFQDPSGSLNPRMRVGRAVREPIEVQGLARGAEAESRVRALFEEVGLDPTLTDRYPHELSGGQKQRVGIARALSVEPEFLVLDEPVSSLDVSVQAQVLNLLDDLRRSRKLAYLLIAHDLAVVRHVADSVSVMYFGRIVEEGPADRIYASPAHPYTAALLSAAPVPDPAAATNRIVLEGELPSPSNPPPGCAFHSRCPHPAKSAECTREVPPLIETEAGHTSACLHRDHPIVPHWHHGADDTISADPHP